MTNKKVNKLSDNDIALMSVVVDEWIKIGTATGPADRPVAEEAIREAYRNANLAEPNEIRWYRSPIEAVEDIVVELEKAGENKNFSFIENIAYGQHDAYWLAFWDFFNRCESVELPEMKEIHPMVTLAKQIGWWWPYDNICFVSERPSEIHFDNGGQLHGEDGPALSYSDGFGVYVWHGYRIPTDKQWIIAEKDRLNPDVIEAEENAELRRIMLEVYGFDKYLEKRKAKLVSEDVDGVGNPRKIYEVKVADEKIRVIEVWNSSLEPDGSRRRFILGAMPGDTPHEAVAASFGFNPDAFREDVAT